MKCVRCGTDNKLRDRAITGRCKNCNHRFAFEPATVTDARFKFTDPFFAKAIADLSDGGTLFFTPKQLFYLLDKRLSSKVSSPFNLFYGAGCIAILFSGGFLLPLAIILIIAGSWFNSNSNRLNLKTRRGSARFLQVTGVIVLIGGMIYGLSMNSFYWFALSVLLGMGSIYLGYRQIVKQTKLSQNFLINQNQFEEWINRWQAINNTISEMLPDAHQSIEPYAVNPELSAFSFDRVIICDTPEIAQLLIANSFHFENNCAVLSVTGYPQNIFSTVLEMLNRNPELKVYAIHNATPRGVGLVHYLRTSPNWFPNSNAIIYDLGLLPRQIFSTRNIFIRNSPESAQEAKEMPQEVKQSLSKDELTWLESGNFVELESFSPKKIIQVLTQGIAQSQQLNSSDGLLFIDGGGYDTPVFVPSESFG